MVKSESKSYAKEEIWYLDYGCNTHMVRVKSQFFECYGSFRETVKLGDNSEMSIMEKVNVKLSIDNKTHVITDVYYLPGLRNDLLSLNNFNKRS